MSNNVNNVIYKITCIINDKSYIGKTTKGMSKRYTTHINNANRGVKGALYNAIRKYGTESFIIECVEICNCPSLLNSREIELIKIHDTYNNGYNMTLGGDGGVYKHDEETIELIREKSIGRKHSEESKQKMSDKKKGVKFTDNHKKKLSENHRGMSGKSHSSATKKKIGDANRKRLTGRKLSEETKAKMRESHKKRFNKT